MQRMVTSPDFTPPTVTAARREGMAAPRARVGTLRHPVQDPRQPWGLARVLMGREYTLYGPKPLGVARHREKAALSGPEAVDVEALGAYRRIQVGASNVETVRVGVIAAVRVLENGVKGHVVGGKKARSR